MRIGPESLKEFQDLTWNYSDGGQRRYPVRAAAQPEPSPTENSMTIKVEAFALDRLFRKVRTRNGRTDRPETKEPLRELYELPKFGPTAPNRCPARFVRVRSVEAKSELAARVWTGSRPDVRLRHEAVNQEFFANTRIEPKFIRTIGHGSDQDPFPRNPRLTFEEVGRLA